MIMVQFRFCKRTRRLPTEVSRVLRIKERKQDLDHGEYFIADDRFEDPAATDLVLVHQRIAPCVFVSTYGDDCYLLEIIGEQNEPA